MGILEKNPLVMAHGVRFCSELFEFLFVSEDEGVLGTFLALQRFPYFSLLLGRFSGFFGL